MNYRMSVTRKLYRNLGDYAVIGIFMATAFASGSAHADQATIETETIPAVLVQDFVAAIEHYGANQLPLTSTAGEDLWLNAFRERGIDPEFLNRRLAKARTRARLQAQRANRAGYFQSPDPFAAFRMITIEKPQPRDFQSEFETVTTPMALHAFKLDVVEDYDDVTNDDIYGYFIVTHDDLLWGKVTSIYRGLDEGTSVFLTPEDRGLFGPNGDKIVPKNQLLVDFGLIESDGEDIHYLQQVSDGIVDLALTALTIYNPQAGVAASQAREETKNLLRLIVSLDDDDRLVTDTLRFNPDSMMSQLSGEQLVEFSREYERETTFTHFDYRLHFRLFQ